MTSENRTSDEIERESRKEREQMSQTIDSLQRKFSVETIVGDLGSMLRTQGSDIGNAITQTVGRNPAAVAMIGAGIAWLVLSQGRRDPKESSTGDWESESERDLDPSQGAWSDHASKSGLLRGNRPDERDRYWYGGVASERGRRSDRRGAITGGPDMDAANGAGAGLMGSMQSAATAVGHAVTGAADSIGQAASDLTARLSHGLEDLSEEARSRVLTARHAAHDARLASEAALGRGTRAATDLYRNQPLVFGALALASGAAMGGLLPHSRIEDSAMGDSSDRLFAEAQALFLEERDKALSVLKDAATDVKDDFKQAGAKLAAPSPKGKADGTANGADPENVPDRKQNHGAEGALDGGTKSSAG